MDRSLFESFCLISRISDRYKSQSKNTLWCKLSVRFFLVIRLSRIVGLRPKSRFQVLGCFLWVRTVEFQDRYLKGFQLSLKNSFSRLLAKSYFYQMIFNNHYLSLLQEVDWSVKSQLVYPPFLSLFLVLLLKTERILL